MKKLFSSISGATAIEYALIAALIAVAILVSVQLTGEAVEKSYNDTSEKVTEATTGG